MKTCAIGAALAIFLAATALVFFTHRSRTRRQWVPTITLGEARTNRQFSARIDAVRFGFQTSTPETPFEYVLIFLVTTNGCKKAILENKPRSDIIALAKSLKEGSYYLFPDILQQAKTNSVKSNR